MKKYLILQILNFFDFFYQRKILKFLKKNNFNTFEVLFDVGAHKGESIKLFLKNFNVNAIYSFEASPINFEKLESATKKYNKRFEKSNIIIENLALGSQNTNILLKQSDESSSSTFNDINYESSYFKKKQQLLKSKNKFFTEIDVKMITLDNYVSQKEIQKIDFLKIDTEGYEYEVLLGMKDTIKKVQLIMFEHHYDNMIKKGYTFTDINKLLIKNHFKKIYKSKMPFRKTFEYIYKREELIN
jgi:FkbM family methyltransferase